MKTNYNLTHLGLSDYAIRTYLALLRHHPINGSQLSKRSGIPRARIYDVLRTLRKRGIVAETEKGLFVPLPPEELVAQLRRNYENDLQRLEALIEAARTPTDHDFIWTVSGCARVLEKAREMIDAAREEIYIRFFSNEAEKLLAALRKAEKRGVPVKCIFMDPHPDIFAIQVVHPRHDVVERRLGGRTFDLVVDKKEFIGGMFTTGESETCRINWGRNQAFVVAGRDSLRHDFFHYFLYKTQTLGQPLNERERALYELILNDM